MKTRPQSLNFIISRKIVTIYVLMLLALKYIKRNYTFGPSLYESNELNLQKEIETPNLWINCIEYWVAWRCLHFRWPKVLLTRWASLWIVNLPKCMWYNNLCVDESLIVKVTNLKVKVMAWFRVVFTYPLWRFRVSVTTACLNPNGVVPKWD